MAKSISDNLKNAIDVEMANAGVYSQGIDAVVAANKFKSSLPENENNQLIRKSTKINKTDKLVKKTPMKKPISKITKSQPIMGEDKSAKKQFKKDLQVDTDYKKFKTKDNEFGTPNVTVSDPFISKGRYKRVGKTEIDEKWSEKYKESINCDNPKGFSQKAHCQGRKKENKEATGSGSAGGFETQLFSTTKKEMQESCWKGYKQVGGKMKNGKMVPNCVKENNEEHQNPGSKSKKVETKEATSSSSSGSYETTSAWAKSTSKKDWRGKSKTQIPGGKFVQVKKKCKKFPYCNQGDIKALKIFENEKLKQVIKNISEKHNISESVIKNILTYEFEKSISKNKSIK